MESFQINPIESIVFSKGRQSVLKGRPVPSAPMFGKHKGQLVASNPISLDL